MDTEATFSIDTAENSTPLVFTSGVSLYSGSTPRRMREFISNNEMVSRTVWNGISSLASSQDCRFYLGSDRQVFIVPLKSDSNLTWPLALKETSSNLGSAPRILSLHRVKKDTDNLINDLVGLLREEEFDELGDPLAPTRHAFDTAWKLIANTAGLCSSKLPIGHVMTDSNGGIRIEWEKGGKHLRLCIAPSKDLPNYMYLQEDTKPRPKYYIRWDCSSGQLAEQLNWLESNEALGVNGNGGNHTK
jgi:hypothetical protein